MKPKPRKTTARRPISRGAGGDPAARAYAEAVAKRALAAEGPDERRVLADDDRRRELAERRIERERR